MLLCYQCDVMDQNIVVTVLATDTVDLDSGHQAVTYAAVGGRIFIVTRGSCFQHLMTISWALC